MTRPVVKWFIFSVVASAVPLLFSALNLFVLRNAPWDATRIIGNGELFIIAVTMCAGGLGELLDAPDRRRIGKLVTGGMCVILLMFAALSFASVSASNKTSAYNVVATSGLTYGASFVATLLSVMLANQEHEARHALD
jgi:hypothetical protein